MNKKYGKLIEGVLIFAPINLVVDDMQIINAEESDYISAGYLPIQYTIKPDDNEWQAVYTEVDGVILQSWVYEGRIHDHSNLEVLNDVTIKSLSGVPAVHTLPTDAKEGDLCLYAPQNTITLADSGKKIYFDWEEFSKPISERAYFYAYLFQANETDGDTNFSISLQRTDHTCDCFIENNSTGFIFNVEFNGGVFTHAYLGDIEYNSIEEIPTYYQLPQFDEIHNYSLEGNAYLFHTEYKLMKYQGGEWIVATQTDIATDRIESAATSATIQPNTDYVFGESETLTINLAHGNKSKRNEYMFSFISGAIPTVLTLPDTVKWANELTIEANKRYEVSIVDNIGLWCAVEVDV